MTERSKEIQETQERIRRVLRTKGQRISPKMQAARDTSGRIYASTREDLRRTGKYEPLHCTVVVHRIVFTVELFPTASFPWKRFEKLPGARWMKPQRLWNQVYSEARRLLCTGGIREISIEHGRTVGYVAPFQISMEPRHKNGWKFDDLNAVLDLLPNYKLTKVEVAFDFPLRSIVDMEFIRRHVLFGKTKPRFVAVNPIHDSWGGRKGMKFVRVYVNWETDRVRLELEGHTRLLQHYGINTPEDFPRLIEILTKKHILFARLDSEKLLTHLRRRQFSERRIKNILEQVSEKEECLWDVKRYLTKRVRLVNVRRRLAPLLEMNQAVREAAERWTAEWQKAQDQCKE